jgi:hypothetical protein
MTSMQRAMFQYWIDYLVVQNMQLNLAFGKSMAVMKCYSLGHDIMISWQSVFALTLNAACLVEK